MGWLLPVGILVVVALSFISAGREVQKMRRVHRAAPPCRRPGPVRAGDWAGIPALHVDLLSRPPATRPPGRAARPAGRSTHPRPQLDKTVTFVVPEREAWDPGDGTNHRGRFN